jgi:signal peptidase I
MITENEPGIELDIDELTGHGRHSLFLRFQRMIKSFSLVLIFFLYIIIRTSFIDLIHIPSGSMIPTLKVGDYVIISKLRYSLRVPFTEIEILRYSNPLRGDTITFISPVKNESGMHYIKRVIGLPGDRIRLQNITADNYNKDNKSAVITYFEYKIKDKGPWIAHSLRRIEDKEARRVLSDSDSMRVLFPDAFPGGWKKETPLLLLETLATGKKAKPDFHSVVESSADRFPGGYEKTLCPEISREGCIIPDEKYFVMGDNRDQSKDSRSYGWINRKAITGKAVMIFFSLNFHDWICQEYARYFIYGRLTPRGFRIDGFPPADQAQYCSGMDKNHYSESLDSFIVRSLFYRLPRVSVRTDRFGLFLER